MSYNRIFTIAFGAHRTAFHVLLPKRYLPPSRVMPRNIIAAPHRLARSSQTPWCAGVWTFVSSTVASRPVICIPSVMSLLVCALPPTTLVAKGIFCLAPVNRTDVVFSPGSCSQHLVPRQRAAIQPPGGFCPTGPRTAVHLATYRTRVGTIRTLAGRLAPGATQTGRQGIASCRRRLAGAATISGSTTVTASTATTVAKPLTPWNAASGCTIGLRASRFLR